MSECYCTRELRRPFPLWNPWKHRPMDALPKSNTLESHARIMQPIWSICALKENIKRTPAGLKGDHQLELIFIQTPQHREENNIMIISVVCLDMVLNPYFRANIWMWRKCVIAQEFRTFDVYKCKSTNRPPIEAYPSIRPKVNRVTFTISSIYRPTFGLLSGQALRPAINKLTSVHHQFSDIVEMVKANPILQKAFYVSAFTRRGSIKWGC